MPSPGRETLVLDRLLDCPAPVYLAGVGVGVLSALVFLGLVGIWIG